MKYWEEDSILNNQTENTPPKEIFQAVCESIGQYFEEQGFKYSRSTPKIVRKDKSHKLEIRFNSSGSNYAGGYVNVEINSNLYSVELAKLDKTKNKFKGLISGVVTPLSIKIPSNYQNASRVVEMIDGRIVEYPLGEFDRKSYIYNRSVNVYKVEEELFGKILFFIENRIVKWYDEFLVSENMISIIRNMGSSAKYSVDISGFYSFLKLRGFTNIKQIKDEIKTVNE